MGCQSNIVLQDVSEMYHKLYVVLHNQEQKEYKFILIV